MHMHRKFPVLSLAAGAMIFSPTTLASAAVEVVYSQVSSYPVPPSNLVPAGAGVPAGTAFRLISSGKAFDRVYRSPDGSRWIISAFTSLATHVDQIIIVGSGTSGATVVREGTAFGSPNAELIQLIFRKMAITDAGQYTFAQNSFGPTAADQYIVKWNGAAFVIAAQEGQPVPGVAGEVWGGTLDSASITNAGTVGFVGLGTVGALPTTEDGFCMLGNTIVAQEGVTVPGGQAGGGTLGWEGINTDDAYFSADGLHHMIVGHLTGTVNDYIVVIDGTVVLQEGIVVPGSGYISAIAADTTGLREQLMMANGDWFVRGSNLDMMDWVVRNGAVIAETDAPIATGSTELFDDNLFAFEACFFFMQGNNNGDYVIGGVTNAADLNANAVLVLNNQTVIAREGDMVDINDNGINDDDAFISVFNNDAGFLTEDGWLYFTADLRNGLGTNIGQAFLRKNITPVLVCLPDVAPKGGDGHVNVSDLLAVINGWGACSAPCPPTCAADTNGDCNVNVTDLLAVINGWGLCP